MRRCRTICNNNRAGGGGIFSNIPSGGIIAWNGSADNVPEGWALCDGENGTPDLRDKFVLGGGGTHLVGKTGGEEKHTLTIDEMPTHNHPIQHAESSTHTVSTTSSGKLVPKGNYYSSTGSTGGSTAHNNMPPYYVLCYIMKT